MVELVEEFVACHLKGIERYNDTVLRCNAGATKHGTRCHLSQADGGGTRQRYLVWVAGTLAPHAPPHTQRLW